MPEWAHQTTMVVFLGLPPPNGYGYSQIVIAGTYGTPIVSCSRHEAMMNLYWGILCFLTGWRLTWRIIGALL